MRARAPDTPARASELKIPQPQDNHISPLCMKRHKERKEDSPFPQNSSPIAVPQSSARDGSKVAAMASEEDHCVVEPGRAPSPKPWGPLSHLQ